MHRDAAATPLTRDDLTREMEHALDGIGIGWAGWPAEAENTQLTARQRLVALLMVMDQSPARVNGWPYRSTENTIVTSFPRKKLPWDEASAVFALEAAMKIDCMNYVCGPALRGAQVAMDAGARGPALFDALSRCAAHLEGLGPGRWGVDADRRHAQRLLSAFMPRGVLDLSALRDGDVWAEPAREAARTAPADAAETLLLVLAELGHKAPSQTWQRRAQAALVPDGSRALLAEWLRLAADVEEFTDPTTRAVRLFAPSNDDVVRAAVITARWLDEDEVPSTLLGALTLRAAATRPPSTESFALRVATAAIDTLAHRNQDADRAELARLLDDLSRRDLVKKIGTVLGAEAVARARDRDAAIATEKARIVRAKASPIPKLLRADVDRELREHVDGTMRDLGFRKGGRTWRRIRGGTVDVVNFYSSGPYMSVQYGVYLTALHPDDGPRAPKDTARLKSHELDVMTSEAGWEAEEDDMIELAERLRTVIVPFVEACGDRRFLAGLLSEGIGMPTNERDREKMWIRWGSHPSQILLGALAVLDGDRAAARWWFEETAAALRDRSAAIDTPDLSYWRGRLEALPPAPTS